MSDVIGDVYTGSQSSAYEPVQNNPDQWQVPAVPARNYQRQSETTRLLHDDHRQPSLRPQVGNFTMQRFLLQWACITVNPVPNADGELRGHLCLGVFFTLGVLGFIMMGVTVGFGAAWKCNRIEVLTYATLAQCIGPLLMLLWMCVYCSRKKTLIVSGCLAWFVAVYFAAVMCGLGTTVVQESPWRLQTSNDHCEVVKYIPLGTLCFLGALASFFSVVSCVAHCCLRKAGPCSF